MDKGAKDKLAGSPGENGVGQDDQKDLHSRTGRDETKRKTQERMEKRSGKRSSQSVGSEKMERVGNRQGQMERYCSTGQSPQRAVAPAEEVAAQCNTYQRFAWKLLLPFAGYNWLSVCWCVYITPGSTDFGFAHQSEKELHSPDSCAQDVSRLPTPLWSVHLPMRSSQTRKIVLGVCREMETESGCQY